MQKMLRLSDGWAFRSIYIYSCRQETYNTTEKRVLIAKYLQQ